MLRSGMHRVLLAAAAAAAHLHGIIQPDLPVLGVGHHNPDASRRHVSAYDGDLRGVKVGRVAEDVAQARWTGFQVIQGGEQ